MLAKERQAEASGSRACTAHVVSVPAVDQHGTRMRSIMPTLLEKERRAETEFRHAAPALPQRIVRRERSILGSSSGELDLRRNLKCMRVHTHGSLL